MKEKHSSNFMMGILFGVMVGVIIWYWQKSTAADEGALDLLDRLAEVDQRLRRAETAVSPAHPVAMEPDDLQQLRGIGPVFDGRLRQADIDTFIGLASVPVERLAEILDIGENRAAVILAEARQINR